MNATRLLIVSAAMEFGAGVALLVAPAMVIRLLFGAAVDVVPAAGIVRLTGAALLALGAACFWARNDDGSVAAGALVGGLLIYNVAVVMLVFMGALGSIGALQWAAVILHGLMGAWCARVMASRRR